LTRDLFPNIFDGSDQQLLDSKQTRAFFGNRSEIWISRRKREREKEIARGGVPFPLGRFIGNREYFLLGDLRQYRDSRPHVRIVHAPPPPTPPKGRRWKKGDKVSAANTAHTTTTPASSD
jgi:hypothetical protein